MTDDFETARWALHYYGDTIPNDREPLAEGDAALDRIQAEVERLRGLYGSLTGPEVVAELTVRLSDTEAEVERLRAGSEGFVREMARLDAEVERLRGEKAKAEAGLALHIGLLEQAQQRVNELEGLLRSAPRGVGADGPWLEWWRQVSQALKNTEKEQAR